MTDQPSSSPQGEGARPDRQSISSVLALLFPRARQVAKQSLGTIRLRYADEEDVALSACWHFYLALRDGRLDEMDDQHQQRLLARMVRQKAIDYVRRARADKRGGGRVRGDSALADVKRGASQASDLTGDPERDALSSAMLAQDRDILLAKLSGDDLRQIVVWKVEGYTNEEIAERMGVCLRTVERKLRLIRKTWSRQR
jgi:DNA-directed RNA polymerase specialized sigma24 family protein